MTNRPKTQGWINVLTLERRLIMPMTTKENSMKDKISGKLKETEGKLTNDKAREGQGKAEQLAGKAKEAMSDAKENVKETIDTVKNKFQHHDH